MPDRPATHPSNARCGALALFFIAVLLHFTPGVVWAASSEFVIAGEPVGVYEPESPWTRVDRALEGRGPEAWLLADHDIGSGDYEIRAILTIADLQRGGALLKIGKGELQLCGEEGQVSTKALEVGEKTTARAPAARTIPEGRPFEIRVQRKGPQLRIWIDRKELLECKVLKRHVGSFGFHPGKSTLRVHEFVASGDLLDVDRRVRIDTAELAALEDEERVDRAIEAAVQYLTAQIEGKQEVYRDADHERSAAGAVALETYALIVAGVSLDHPVVEGNLKYIQKELVRTGQTYDLACGLFALDAAIVQLEQDLTLVEAEVSERELLVLGKKHRRTMKKLLDTLLDGQNVHGAWRYDTNSTDFDHSCTQFAVLGLAVAARRGLKIPDAAWIRLTEHLLAAQQQDGPETTRRATLEDTTERTFAWSESGRRKRPRRGRGEDPPERRGGTEVGEVVVIDPFVGDESVTVHARGWNYAQFATDRSTWNMTCSGVSSLMIVYAHGGYALPLELRKKVSTSIRDGLGWMMENWSPHGSAYSVYSLEKVADIGSIGLFDGRDWYADARRWILDTQKKDGSWDTNGTGEVPRVSTALQVLVLKRATTLLTRDPSESMVVTGTRGEESSDETRAWIYVPRLDRSVHFTSLLRTLRMRPNAALMKLLEEVCSEYPDAHVPETIPALLDVRERIRGKGPLASLDRCLVKAVGRELRSPKDYRTWFETWTTVCELEGDESLDRAARLTAIYGNHPDDSRLKRVILPILIRIGARESIDAILPDLAHREVSVRTLVYRAIGSFFPEDPPPFDPGESSRVRAAQVEKIETWVRERIGARAPR